MKFLKPIFKLRLWLCFAAAGMSACTISTTGLPAQDSLTLSEELSAPTGTDPSSQLELDSDGSSALLRGPVHEAFAEQFSADASPAEVIAKQPPEPIDELPPEFKPEGENIQWIPGYWGWDVASDDFVWVTGLWRNFPPGRQWVPGYWTPVEDGWQWVSGFWTDLQTSQLEYLPLPPDAIDNGPSTPAPGEDYFWIPGSWQHNQNQYSWQAGYWAQGYDDWIWIPNRYVWTPSGCIYREGYWDHVVQSRGTMFCPMYFQAGYHQQFRPRYVVETGPLWLANLFVMPGYHHYGFGNYYGYSGRSQIYPWVNYYQRSRGYDPLYAYYAYQPRNANLIRQIARVERQISVNPQYRAQTTVAGQLRALQGVQGPHAAWAMHPVPLQALATQGNLDFDTPFRFASIDAQQQSRFSSAINPARQLAAQRRELEQAHTPEDQQRARRDHARGQGPEAHARADGQADVQVGEPAGSGPGAAAASGDSPRNLTRNVKRLQFRADKGKEGQGIRLAPVDPNAPDIADSSINARAMKPRATDRPNVPPRVEDRGPKPDRGREDARTGDRARAVDPNRANKSANPLDLLNLNQEAADQGGPEDARALREMMRRTPRGGAAKPAVGSRSGDTRKPAPGTSAPGNLAPGKPESAKPDAGKPDAGKPRAGSGRPGARPGNLGAPRTESGAQVPGSQAPGAQVPGGQIPGVQAPGTRVPSVQLPGAKAPVAQAPGGPIPGVQIPGVRGARGPGAQPPGAQAPGVRGPGPQAPGPQAPRARGPGARAPAAQAPAAQAPSVQTPSVQTPAAGPRGPGAREPRNPAAGSPARGGAGNRGAGSTSGAAPGIPPLNSGKVSQAPQNVAPSILKSNTPRPENPRSDKNPRPDKKSESDRPGGKDK